MNQPLPRILVTAIFLSLPLVAHAQEATVTGTVTDSTGGVLPGVTIKAVNAASGNSFEAVTDARGGYRLAVRIGGYQITATLAGFGTVSRNLELLVGQTTVVNLQLAPSTVQEMINSFHVSFPPDSDPRAVVSVYPTQIMEVIMGVIMGFVWEHRLSGGYSWGDPKVIITLAILAAYVAYLRLSRSTAWRGARAAKLCAFNFGVVLFSYTFVNLYMTRFHRFF